MAGIARYATRALVICVGMERSEEFQCSISEMGLRTSLSELDNPRS
jgi:hypothetical protein